MSSARKKGGASSRPHSARMDTSAGPPEGFTAQEWAAFLRERSAQEAGASILSLVLAKAMEEIDRREIDRNVQGHAVQAAVDSLRCLVELNFLNRDPGESDAAADPGWQTGDEPVPPPIDSWAPGSLPVRIPGQEKAARALPPTAQEAEDMKSSAAVADATQAATKIAAHAKVKASATAASRVAKRESSRPSSGPERFQPRPPSDGKSPARRLRTVGSANSMRRAAPVSG